MEEEKKVIYRFDVDFKGTASTAPVINLASTDVHSRMFVMTPKSGAETLKLDADVSSLMVISYTSNGIKKIVGTLSCEYVNGKFVSDIPAFKNNNITDYDGSLILYRSNGGTESELSYKLESAPFKLQIVSSGATPGTVTAADEFKALTEAAATAEFYNKVWDDLNSDSDKITVSISNRDFINHKVIWVNPKAGKTAATKSGALTLYFSDSSSAEIKIVEPNGSFSSTVPLKRIRNGQLLCLWLISPSTAIWINAIEDNLVVRTSSDSFDANNQLKINKGLKVLSNGSVTALDDALIPYPGAISGNTITFTPPSGYNANGIFAVKLSDGTNAGGTIKAKSTGSSVEFTVSAYAGTKAITNFTAGVINADIPMLFLLKGRELIWMNYDVGFLMETTYDDICPKDSGASENDLKIAVADIASLKGQIISVKPNVEKNTYPDITGRMYLLNMNQSIHSASQQVGYPIAVVDPDTGEYVKGDITHYNKYSVPMNFKGIMRLLIKDGFAVWLNPPFYYCIDADEMLGDRLTPYDDQDWKCRIMRGPGFATVQGVCKVKDGMTFNPGTAGARDIIKAGLPFRPITHIRSARRFSPYSGGSESYLEKWYCSVDCYDGSVWAYSSLNTYSYKAGECFYVDITYPVISVND